MGKEQLAYGPIELAKATDTSVQFIRDQIRKGRLKAVRCGRRVLVRSEWVDEWLKAEDSARLVSRGQPIRELAPIVPRKPTP
jgi:excisionase family DNA binding protein